MSITSKSAFMKKQTLLITIMMVTFNLLVSVSCKKSSDSDNPTPNNNNPSDTTKHTTTPSGGDTTIAGVVDDNFYYINFTEGGSYDSLNYNFESHTTKDQGALHTIYSTFFKKYGTIIPSYNIDLFLPNKQADFNKFVKDSTGIKVITKNKTIPNTINTLNGSIHVNTSLNSGELFVYCESTVKKVLYIKGTNDVIVEGFATEITKQLKSNQVTDYTFYNKRVLSYRLKLTLAD